MMYSLRQQLVTELLLGSRYCSGYSINSSEQHKSLVKELIFWWGGTEMDLKNKQKLKYRLKYILCWGFLKPCVHIKIPKLWSLKYILDVNIEVLWEKKTLEKWVEEWGAGESIPKRTSEWAMWTPGRKHSRERVKPPQVYLSLLWKRNIPSHVWGLARRTKWGEGEGVVTGSENTDFYLESNEKPPADSKQGSGMI